MLFLNVALYMLEHSRKAFTYIYEIVAYWNANVVSLLSFFVFYLTIHYTSAIIRFSTISHNMYYFSKSSTCAVLPHLLERCFARIILIARLFTTLRVTSYEGNTVTHAHRNAPWLMIWLRMSFRYACAHATCCIYTSFINLSVTN